MKKSKLPSLKTLSNKAWALMSEFSRRKDAINDWTSCFTCGRLNKWNEVDAGHLIHASKFSPVSYDDRNIHAQCRRCNYYASDAKINGAMYVEKRYGGGTIENLWALKRSPSLRRGGLERIIDDLTEKLRKLS